MIFLGLVFLFMMVAFPIFIFKSISGGLKFLNFRNKIFHEIVMKQMRFENDNIGVATGDDAFNSGVNQFNANQNATMNTKFKMTDEQLKIFESYIPKSKPLAISRAIKKTFKTTVKFSLVSFGIMIVFYTILILINHFVFMYA
ncbi:hypothetical protein [Alkaliphilus sp. B6464]|uniref:hypothetical protein n=1 Tax=Alkaliphilus sp. B6464 TaxID=2731219 RepID=UPI001BA49F7A|nr:hypothetical protein [Alkaliphilus sp. B6464]QUH22018.1 hypothetical protein HYG84_19120 [Alkaliphilus sp. B6464]